MEKLPTEEELNLYINKLPNETTDKVKKIIKNIIKNKFYDKL